MSKGLLIGSLVGLVSLLATGELAAHGCEHSREHVHVDAWMLARMASLYPDLTEEQLFRLLQPDSPAAPVIGSAPICPATNVQPPAGWFSGDTHVHIQGDLGGDATPQDVIDDMTALQLSTVSGLIWGFGFVKPDEYDALYEPFISGSPDAASTSTAVLQFGMETSGFSASHFGHHIGLNIDQTSADIFDAQTGCAPLWDPVLHPERVDWPQYLTDLEAGPPVDPNAGIYLSDGSGGFHQRHFELFKQRDAAVTGWAHQRWNRELYDSNGVDVWSLPAWVTAGLKCNDALGQKLAFPSNLSNQNYLHPVFLPIDAAMKWVDFLEAVQLDGEVASTRGPVRWYGAWYKLLNAGMRVGISGGTDSPLTEGLWCQPRTYVNTGGALPDYDAWTAGLKDGRVSLASSGHHMLDLSVDYQSSSYAIGDQIEVDSSTSTTVLVSPTYTIESDGSMQRADELEIVVNGQVVASHTYGPLSAGSHVISFPTPVSVSLSASSWIAARTGHDTTDEDDPLGWNPGGSSHTGALYAILDKAPIGFCPEAEYWMLYGNTIKAVIEVYENFAGTPLGDWLILKTIGCQPDIDAMKAYLDEGVEMFAAVRDWVHGTPDTVLRYGHASYPPGKAPSGMNIDRDPASSCDKTSPLVFTAFNAPRNQPKSGQPPETLGWLVIGMGSLPGVPVNGVDLFVDSTHGLILPVPVNAGGYARYELAYPDLNAPGATLYTQFVFFSASEDAPVGGGFTATDALQVFVPDLAAPCP